MPPKAATPEKYSFFGKPDFARILKENPGKSLILITSGSSAVLAVENKVRWCVDPVMIPKTPQKMGSGNYVIYTEDTVLHKKTWRFIADTFPNTGMLEWSFLSGQIDDIRQIAFAAKKALATPPKVTVEPIA